MPNTMILVLVLLVLVAALSAPGWPHMTHFDMGWGPSGLLGVVAVALIVLWFFGG